MRPLGERMSRGSVPANANRMGDIANALLATKDDSPLQEDSSDRSAQSLRIAFLGTADFAVPTLRAIAAGSHVVVAVFTPPDRPAGRGRKLRPPPVKVAAQERGLPVFQPEKVSRGEGLDRLQNLSPDVLFVVAFGEILLKAALDVPSMAAVNLHASLLPAYRGAAPIQRALLAGERVTGVTVQWMADEMDAGDIILRKELSIGEDEDFGIVHGRLAALGAEAAVQSLDLLSSSTALRIPQDNEHATYAPPIEPSDLVIDWGRPAAEILRMVRAFAPRPGARSTRSGGILKFLSAREEKKTVLQGGIPGQIMEFTDEGFVVTTGDGGLLVLRVQPAGRKAISAADYVRGYRLQRGERLGI